MNGLLKLLYWNCSWNENQHTQEYFRTEFGNHWPEVIQYLSTFFSRYFLTLGQVVFWMITFTLT